VRLVTSFFFLFSPRAESEGRKEIEVRTDDNVVAPRFDVGDGELHRACAQREVLCERVICGAILNKMEVSVDGSMRNRRSRVTRPRGY
jgi:hypothetical protein